LDVRRGGVNGRKEGRGKEESRRRRDAEGKKF
jgi:hypothetical protein